MYDDTCCHSLSTHAIDVVNVALSPSLSNNPPQRKYQQ